MKETYNSIAYSFKDFTRDNYITLLRIAKDKYTFRQFTDFDQDDNFVLWRHDIDVSPQSARRLAEIEAKEGITATYFVHLHSEFYNLFEKGVTGCIQDIVNMGHIIGLHFNASYYSIEDNHELERYLEFEKNLVARLFGQDISTFSFHDPDGFVLTCREAQYAGLINVYSDYFRKQVAYCSDSNGFWRFERLEDVLRSGNYKSLQVLTHPCYWTKEIMSPRQRIWRCIDGRADATRKWWASHLSDNGREDVDWE